VRAGCFCYGIEALAVTVRHQKQLIAIAEHLDSQRTEKMCTVKNKGNDLGFRQMQKWLYWISVAILPCFILLTR
jgi:hypothetical protein